MTLVETLEGHAESGQPACHVTVLVDRCAGCQECVIRCATGALGMDTVRWVAVAEDAACVGCLQCERTCPFSAIVVEGPRVVAERTKLPSRRPDPIENSTVEIRAGFPSVLAARAEAERCLRCPDPTCVRGCPAHNDIPGFSAAIADGDLERAHSVLRRTTVLPDICARVCDQAVQCEGCCTGRSRAGRLSRSGARAVRDGPRPGPASGAPQQGRGGAVGGDRGVRARRDRRGVRAVRGRRERHGLRGEFGAGWPAALGYPRVHAPRRGGCTAVAAASAVRGRAATWHAGHAGGPRRAARAARRGGARARSWGAHAPAGPRWRTSRRGGRDELPLPGEGGTRGGPAARGLRRARATRGASAPKGARARRGQHGHGRRAQRAAARWEAGLRGLDGPALRAGPPDELAEAEEEGVEVRFCTTLLAFEPVDGRVGRARLAWTVQRHAAERPTVLRDGGVVEDVDIVVAAMGYRLDGGFAAVLPGTPVRREAEGLPDRRWQASGLLAAGAPPFAHGRPVGRLALGREVGIVAAAFPFWERTWVAGDALVGPSTVVEAMAQGRDAARAVLTARPHRPGRPAPGSPARVLVGYESRSGTRASLAEELGRRLSGAGHEVSVLPLSKVGSAELALADLVVVGSFVEGFVVVGVGPAKRARRWLASLPPLAGRPVAVFCTYKVSPKDTLGAMARAFEEKGAEVVASAAFGPGRTRSRGPADSLDSFAAALLAHPVQAGAPATAAR